MQLLITKDVNFIYGKNGTGKTTITDAIESQLSGNYNVCIFKDFDGVAQNDRLNAVALGTENAEIQKKIDVIDAEIVGIKKQIEKPEDKDFENLFTKAEKAKRAFGIQDKKVDDFYSSAAQQIKNINNPSVAKTSYNKKDFRDEIPKANLLPSADVIAYKKIIKADKKEDIISTSFPITNLREFVRSTNEVLQSAVKQPESILELKDNPAKQSFAKQGIEVHERKNGEVCAFCGNTIDEERWVLLGGYFNNEVKALETRIHTGITRLSEELNALDAIKEIDKNLFYEKFSDQIKILNLQIRLKKKEHKEFLEVLKSALTDKKDKLFVETDPLQVIARQSHDSPRGPADSEIATTTQVAVPQGFNDIQAEYNELVKSSNELSSNLKSEQDKARDVIRYHEIKKSLDKTKYTDEYTKLEELRAVSDVAQANLDDRKAELNAKHRGRIELILQTKDEEAIARKINELLKGMGVASFSLKPVSDEDESQKGQYQIKGHNGDIRPVTELSKGEKNIIAFLYFLFSLEKADGDSRPKIVVLDDPMTSNDDTMQYLMIGEIQKFYRRIRGNGYLILLTHNCHFYLNVRPNTATTYKQSGQEISFYEKYGVYHLLSNGKHTTIKSIAKGKQDFKTSYETLWKELVFLYDTDDASPDLMLNPCRKICETYMHFTKVDGNVFYENNPSAKKLFDVNQHSIDDLEAEPNGKTKDEIRDILRDLFKGNSAEEHFNSYWKVS